MTRNGTALCQLRRFIDARAALELTDADLLRAFVTAGDPAAFEAIVRRHGGLVLGTCRRQLRQESDVEDCFQATFVVLLRKAGSIRNGDSLAAWLCSAAVRVCRHARSRRQPQPRERLEVASSPPCDVESRDLARFLDDEVQRLPERYRAPVLLCHFEGHTQEQAARVLGVPLGTVATRVSRGLRLLRERLARRGLDVPAIVPPPLPDALIEKTIQGAGEAATRLATAVLRHWAMARLGRVALVVLVLAGTAAGAGYLFGPKPADRDPEPPPIRKQEVRQAEGWAERVRFRVGPAAGPVQVIAFSRDGATLAVVAGGAIDGGLPDPEESTLAIRLFDARTGRARGKLIQLQGATSSVQGLAFHGDRLLASGGGLYSWGVGEKTRRVLVPEQQLMALLAFDGGTAAIQAPDGVRLYDSDSGKRLATLSVATFASDAVFLPGGREVVTLDVEQVAAWDRTTGRRLRRTPLPQHVNWPTALSPDGRRVAFVHALGRDVRVWDVTSGQTQTVADGHGTQMALCFSPDGRLLAISHKDGVRLWDVSACRDVPAPPGKTDSTLFRLSFAPDGNTLAAGDLRGGIVVWSWSRR